MNRDDNSLVIFIAGLGVGVIGTLLLAPLSGEQVRSRIKSGAGKANDYLKDRTTALSDVVAQGKRTLADAVSSGKDSIDDMKNNAQEKLEDAAWATRKAADKAVNKSRDLAHAAGSGMEEGGKKLQGV
jgi:gas vesicle protein